MVEIEKNTDKIAIQSFTVPRVSGANGRASGPVLQSVFLAVIDHSGGGGDGGNGWTD